MTIIYVEIPIVTENISRKVEEGKKIKKILKRSNVNENITDNYTIRSFILNSGNKKD